MNGKYATLVETDPDRAARAALVAEGELYAAAFLYCVDAGLADPDGLHSTVALLGGDLRIGFCRRLQQRLGGQHG